MANEIQAVPKQPVTETVVTPEVLRAFAAINASTFSGDLDPTLIWDAMMNDRREAYTYYRQIEEKDPHTDAMLDVRRTGVLRRPWTIQAASEAPEDTARAEFVRKALERLPDLERVREDQLDAPGYGAVIQELLWEFAEGAVLPADVKTVPQEFFSFGDRWDRSQTGPLNFIGAYGSEQRLMPDHKFIVFSFRPRNGNRRGRPLLRKIFWFSWAKRQLIRFMLQQAEKGNGTIAVKYPSGTSSADEKQKALAAAEAIFTEPFAAVPENFGIITELLQGVRSGSAPDYLARIEKCDEYITRRVLGQTLTTQGSEKGMGSRSLGQVHEATEEDIDIADARRQERVMNQQLVRPLMLFNFGPTFAGREVPMPQYVVDKSKPKDIDEELRVQTQLADRGVEVPLGHVKKTFSIPERKPGEPVLEASRSVLDVIPPTEGIPQG